MKVGGFAAVFVFSAQAAAAFSIPDCAGLAGWIATPGAPAPFNAAGPLPPAYAPEATRAVFGAPLLDWSATDVKALDGALNGCRGEANRAKDTEAAAAFTDARRALGAVARRLRDRETAREAIDKALAAVDAAAPSAALRQSLVNLAAASEGEMARALSPATEPRPIGRAGDRLTAGESAALRLALAERAEAMTQALVGDAGAAFAAASATLDGILALRKSALDARSEMGDGAVGVVAAAEAREAEIAATLAATDPAPVTLPSCADLVGWGATLRPQDSRRARAGIVVTGLEAPELAALFGKSFDRWDAGDIDAMGKLAVQCREAGRAGLLGGDPRAMMRAGQNIVVLHAQVANQPPIFAALAASRAEADRIAAAAAAAPDGGDGLGALAALRRDAAALEEADAARAAAAIEARRAALTAAELARIEAELAAAPATPEGLVAMLGTAALAERGPLAAHLDAAERAVLRDMAGAAAARIAPAAAAGFEAMLAALPETGDGMAEAKGLAASLPGDVPALAPLRAAALARATAIDEAMRMAALPAFEAELAALPDSEESLVALLGTMAFAAAEAADSPARGAYAAAAAARASALRDDLAAARCAPAVAGLSASDAARPVLLGTAIATLGDLLCGMSPDGAPRYAAPGFFGSRHSVEATVSGGFAVKLLLVEGDVPLGGKALIGTRIEDRDGARDVAVAEWQDWTGAMVGGAGACAFAAEGFGEALRRGWDARALAEDLGRCLVANPAAPIPFGG